MSVLFPNGDRAVVGAVPGGTGRPLVHVGGAVRQLFTDQAATIPASGLLAADGETELPGGIVTLDELSRWPLFYAPDGTTVLYDKDGNALRPIGDDVNTAELAAAVASVASSAATDATTKAAAAQAAAVAAAATDATSKAAAARTGAVSDAAAAASSTSAALQSQIDDVRIGAEPVGLSPATKASLGITVVSAGITGTPQIGQVLTAVGVGVTNATYQWTRNGVNIAGATAATYTLVSADLGKAIACELHGNPVVSAKAPALTAVPASTFVIPSLTSEATIFRTAVAVTGASTTGYMTQTTMRTVKTTTKVRVRLTGWYLTSTGPELDASGPWLWQHTLRIAGVDYPVYYAGVRTGTVQPGGTLVSDWITLGAPLAAGSDIKVRGFFTAQPDNIVPKGTAGGGPGLTTPPAGDGNYSSGNIIDQNPGPGLTGGILDAMGPVLEFESPNKVFSVFCLGDSIANASGETAPNTGAAVALGFFNRALNHTIPGKRVCLPGMSAGLLRLGTRWPATAEGFTHAIVPLGSNDLSHSLATIQADLVACWTMLNAYVPKVYGWTVTPRVGSTDSFATTTNQTDLTGNMTKRVPLNEWIRDGAPLQLGVAVAVGTTGSGVLRFGDVGHPAAGYIEAADALETSRNSGKYIVTGAANGYTSDGIHPNAAAAQILGNVVRAFLDARAAEYALT